MRTFVQVFPVVLCVYGLAACSPESPLVVEDAVFDGPADLEVLSSEVRPLYWDEELLANAAFTNGVREIINDWEQSVGRCAELVREKGGPFDSYVRLNSDRGPCVLEQTFAVNRLVRNMTLDLTAQVQASEPHSVYLMASYLVDDKPLRFWTSNSGGEQWETLQLTTKIPDGVDLSDVTYRIGAWAGEGRVAETSAMMRDVPASAPCTGFDRVWNGGFEYWIGQKPEGWQYMRGEFRPETKTVHQGETAFGMAPFAQSSAVEQEISLPACSIGKTIEVEALVHQPRSQQAAVLLLFMHDGKERDRAVSFVTGVEGYERLAIQVPYTEEAAEDTIVLRLWQAPNANTATLFDGVSLRVTDGPGEAAPSAAATE